MKKRKLISIGVALIAITSILFLSGCMKEKKAIGYKMNLEVWGFIDDSDVFQEISNNYTNINPQIQNINYRKISSNMEEFEKELLNAIASGKSPDVIFFHNSWLMEHGDKIAPHPQSGENLNLFQKRFIDVASTDFIKDSKIYAMPLYSDTLALFYNKDIFNQEAITKAPETWEELKSYSEKITKIDQTGNFSRSAIALGRSKNPGGVNRASDIITLMFMQNGIDMLDENGRAGFDKNPKSESILNSYADFARNSTYYTWNAKMDYSIDSFRFGKTAMMINYSYMANRLRTTDPKLNFEVAPVPQVDMNNKMSHPNYWGLAVVKNKTLIPESPNQVINYTNEDRINEAWKYIRYITMGTMIDPEGKEVFPEPNATERYLELTNKPAARKDLIEKQKSNPELGIFAVQALTAKSWEKPSDLVIEPIFNEMIDSVVSGKSTTSKALEVAASRINILKEGDF